MARCSHGSSHARSEYQVVQSHLLCRNLEVQMAVLGCHEGQRAADALHLVHYCLQPWAFHLEVHVVWAQLCKVLVSHQAVYLCTEPHSQSEVLPQVPALSAPQDLSGPSSIR